MPVDIERNRPLTLWSGVSQIVYQFAISAANAKTVGAFYSDWTCRLPLRAGNKETLATQDSYLFTSESVSEGHPDKVADQICDSVLNAILEQDPNPERARVACETMGKAGTAVVGGEITADAWIDLDELDPGRDPRHWLHWLGCGLLRRHLRGDVPDRQAARRHRPGRGPGAAGGAGAGDQGLMFGYATNETEVLMPLTITLAHHLVERQSEMRKQNVLPCLRPDAERQVTARYEDGRVTAGVLSTQHDADIDYRHLREAVMENIILPVLPQQWLHGDTEFHINPSGTVVIGGPAGDCGLTWAQDHPRHLRWRGSPRWRRLLGQGIPPRGRPLRRLCRALRGQEHQSPRGWRTAARSRSPTPQAWPSRPRYPSTPSAPPGSRRSGSQCWCTSTSTCAPTASIQMLDLIRPICRKTTAYGHFGRELPEFT